MERERNTFLEIENKNSEEKEAKQPAEKARKKKDHVLQDCSDCGNSDYCDWRNYVVARRLSNPQKDTTKGTEILKTMDGRMSEKADKKIQKLRKGRT